MPETFFTSDTHFNHTNILKYCNRPFGSVEEMDKALIANWNRRVKPEDTVYHLGDFAMGPKQKWPEYRAKLNGKIIFTLGNHDLDEEGKLHWGLRHALQVRDETHEDLSIADIGRGLFMHLAHVPPHGLPNGGHREDLARRPVREGDFNLLLCGHIHTAWKTTTAGLYKTRVINVGVDVWDYEPITIEEILNAM